MLSYILTPLFKIEDPYGSRPAIEGLGYRTKLPHTQLLTAERTCFYLRLNLQITLTAESFGDTALLWDRVRNGFREISQLPPSPQNHESALSSGPDDRKTTQSK